ncbi:MAG: response regulator [Candidatus Obscuribacterales bacterium]|nr:response regulator [Candidatus Obscuribacterales bacterium]
MEAFDARQFQKWLHNTTDRNLKDAIYYVLAANKKLTENDPDRDERLIDKKLLESNELGLDDPQMQIIHKVIATNDTTPPGILDFLGSVADESVRLRVAENKNSPADTLNKLAQDECVEVRVAVAENCSTTAEIMSILSNDECADVRYAVAENPETPQEILINLEEDDNPYVAHRAQQTIQKTEPIRNPARLMKVSTVLIVDDDHFIRALLKEQICSDPTFTVIGEASNGLDGLDQVLHLKPDIVLMDIGLPMLNGVASTQHIKAEIPKVKVLMVTSRDDDADIIGAIEAGADGYLLKSGSSDNLLTALHQLASNNSWIDPGVASTVLRQCIRQPNVKSAPLQLPATAPQPVNAAITVVFDMASKATKEGKWDVARTLCQAALQIAEAAKDVAPQEISQLLSKLADTCYTHEDYKASESLYLKALEVRQTQLDETDPKLDNYVTFLAKLYESAGNNQQAELYYSWSLRIREQSGDQGLITEAQERLENVMTPHKEG